ncbi:MAG TPA: hypothetical protein VMT00_03120 [Thermoanaerobaculia bacterium]|nr:hypothetical protein [Thermoanaerobaculia bacterium]
MHSTRYLLMLLASTLSTLATAGEKGATLTTAVAVSAPNLKLSTLPTSGGSADLVSLRQRCVTPPAAIAAATPEQKRALEDVIKGLRARDLKSSGSSWKTVMNAYQGGSRQVDLLDIICWVVGEAYALPKGSQAGVSLAAPVGAPAAGATTTAPASAGAPGSLQTVGAAGAPGHGAAGGSAAGTAGSVADPAAAAQLLHRIGACVLSGQLCAGE